MIRNLEKFKFNFDIIVRVAAMGGKSLLLLYLPTKIGLTQFALISSLIALSTVVATGIGAGFAVVNTRRLARNDLDFQTYNLGALARNTGFLVVFIILVINYLSEKYSILEYFSYLYFITFVYTEILVIELLRSTVALGSLRYYNLSVAIRGLLWPALALLPPGGSDNIAYIFWWSAVWNVCTVLVGVHVHARPRNIASAASDIGDYRVVAKHYIVYLSDGLFQATLRTLVFERSAVYAGILSIYLMFFSLYTFSIDLMNSQQFRAVMSGGHTLFDSVVGDWMKHAAPIIIGSVSWLYFLFVLKIAPETATAAAGFLAIFCWMFYFRNFNYYSFQAGNRDTGVMIAEVGGALVATLGLLILYKHATWSLTLVMIASLSNIVVASAAYLFLRGSYYRKRFS